MQIDARLVVATTENGMELIYPAEHAGDVRMVRQITGYLPGWHRVLNSLNKCE